MNFVNFRQNNSICMQKNCAFINCPKKFRFSELLERNRTSPILGKIVAYLRKKTANLKSSSSGKIFCQFVSKSQILQIFKETSHIYKKLFWKIRYFSNNVCICRQLVRGKKKSISIISRGKSCDFFSFLFNLLFL